MQKTVLKAAELKYDRIGGFDWLHEDLFMIKITQCHINECILYMSKSNLINK